jgi:hypothetical protein
MLLLLLLLLYCQLSCPAGQLDEHLLLVLLVTWKVT